MRKFSTRSIALAAMTLAGLTLVSSNIYLAAGESSQINGCVNKKTQVLRIAEKCATNETKISWSKSSAPAQTDSASTELGFHQVLDATGKVVGNLIGSTVYETVVLIGKSKVPYSDVNGAAVAMFDGAAYLKPDCTGSPYQITDGFTNRFTIEHPYIEGDSILGIGRDRFAAISISKPIKKYQSEMFFVSRERGDGKWACTQASAGSKGEVDTQIEIQELKIIEGIPMKVPVPFTIK
ncbi:MAG: hypothetical protein EBR75_06575 [Actinobacteria bacterium]|nr:hypothetical protein [Actinomycetota bacterium]